MFWAEHDRGLTNVFSSLKELAEKYPHQPYFKPSELLTQVSESGASLKEELFFRNKSK